MEWEFDACRAYYEGLAAKLRLVRYDCRGAGLSDRDVTDFSLEAYLRDVLAIADKLRLDRFAVMGFGHSGTAAISMAALHPERVSHVVLWCSYPRGPDYARGPRVEATRSLMDQSWDMWTRAEGFRLSEWEGGETSRWFTEYVRESLTPAATKAAVSALRTVDVVDLLPKVQAPALVLHRKGLAAITVEMATEMASSIPNARLMLLDGSWIAPYFGGGTQAIVAAISGFVLTPSADPAATAVTALDVGLTPRETEVLSLIAKGRTSGEISRELGLSIRTVGRHITNIYDKLGVQGRAEATAYALRHGIA
jgi:DNA-binding CsgD family transcriptional regulator/pimeloyl-ACP methyl ester carboxylesterase